MGKANSMELSLREANECSYLEGSPDQVLMRSADDSTELVGACFEQGVRKLLLYSENLTGKFFDLSSGEAGEVLQKLRNYNIQLAVVRAPDQHLSQYFKELLIDEHQGPHFRLVEQRAEAEEWLCQVDSNR